MKGLETLLEEHPFFRGMEPADLTFLAGCAANAVYEAGDYLFREGEAATKFFLLRHGRVAVQVHGPGRGTWNIMTVHDGNVLGFAWLMPPHRWLWDGRALDLTRVVVFDGECLREKCDADPRMGYELMKRVSRVMTARLEAATVQLADVYDEGVARP